jgi:hypothetical protein
MTALNVAVWDGETLEVSTSPVPPPTFVLLSATDYRHLASCVLSVNGLTEAFNVRWSPSGASAFASGSVALTVTGTDLDVEGDGTVTVTGQRGIVRYNDTGYLWLVVNEASASLAKVLLPHGGRQVVVGVGVEQPWATGQAVSIGARRWVQSAGSVGRLYEATSAGTTGATAPTHASGTVSDGAVSWLFVQDYMRLDALPDLADGDQVAWWGTPSPGSVSVAPDFTFEADENVISFWVEAHTPDFGYGAAAQQVLGSVTLLTVPNMTHGQPVTLTGIGFGA